MLEHRPVKRLGTLLFVAVPLLLASNACGSRGPLLDDEFLDASTDATDTVVDAAPEASTTVDASPRDAGRESSGSIIDCGACLIQQCSPAIIQCIGSQPCVQAFQCVIQDCLGAGGSGGGANPLCLLKCASGDPQGALQVLQVFQCVTGMCGSDCTSLLGGLGGLGGGLGGGGGGGGKKDAGMKFQSDREQQQAFAQAFSAWPELCGPLLDK